MNPKKKNPITYRDAINDEENSLEDPTSVVSMSECTGLFAAMPDDQEDSLALNDIVNTHPSVVPKMGKEESK